MIKIAITFIAFLTLTCSCISIKKSPQNFWFDNVTETYLQQLKIYDNKITICGSGGGTSGGNTHDKITKFFFSLECHRSVDILEAREIAVASFQKFTNIVENEPNINPHLLKCPFDRKIVEFILSFSRDDCSDTRVHGVFYFRDELAYRRWSPEENKCVTFYRESYEDALRICGYL